MKKVLVMLTALLFALFMISCGDSKDDPETDDNQVNDEGDTGGDEDIADTGNTGETDEDSVVPACKIGDEIIEKVDGYTSYFAFNGVGTINAANIFETGARPESAMIAELGFEMEGYPERVLSQSFNFFLDDPDNPNGPSTSLQIYGDPVGQSYTTIALTSMPHGWIETFKEEGVTTAAFSTMVQVYSIESVSSDTTKICILAVSELEEVEGGQLPVGKLAVCYDKNESFAAGEIFKFGVNAKLTTDKQAIIDMFSDVETEEDLCFCQKDGVEGTVDCPVEVTDEDDTDNTDDDVTDDDPYVDPCTPTNPCVDANKTVCTDTNEDGVAECGCNEGYTLDGGTVCINSKNVNCTDNAPANATSTVAQVAVTWNGTAWSTAADCEWTCDDNFMLNETSDGCVAYVDPCTPTNPCVDANKTVCTDANEDGVAECACDEGYHDDAGDRKSVV